MLRGGVNPAVEEVMSFYVSPAPLRLCSGSLDHAEFAESDVLVGPISLTPAKQQ